MTIQKIHKLILHPQDTDFSLLSWDSLVDRLHELKFLDGPISEDQPNRFLIGDRFFQYITFTGCSPSLDVTPTADGGLDFCHVHFGEITPLRRFRSASQNVFARCPHCRKRIGNWEHAVSLWSNDSTIDSFVCDKCAEQVSLYQLGWRHTAAFSRTFIDIFSVFPQEGIPTDSLLSLLETHTGVKWHYFFTDQ